MSSLFLLFLAMANLAQANDDDAGVAVEDTPASGPDKLRVKIADPFIELHTGPGSGYPIFYVIDRGAEVRVIRRKNDWFKIETDDGKTGWASREQMQLTLLPSGERLTITDNTEEDFVARRWVLGVTSGEFESAPVFTIFAAYSFTENLAAELHFGQSIGEASSAKFLKTNVVMQPLPDWKYSPYMTLGLGEISVDPSATLISPANEDSSFGQFGLGIQRYISRSFLARFEVNEYVIFSTGSTSDENEEVNEWKFGFAVFF